MKLAVRFYKDCPNPQGIAEHWPADVREIADDHEVIKPWVKMTLEEYNAYRADHWVENKKPSLHFTNLVDSPVTHGHDAPSASFWWGLAGVVLGLAGAKFVLTWMGAH